MLKSRVKHFLEDLELPVAVFCRKVKISHTAYYEWMKGSLNFTDETEDRIRAVLDKYNF